MPRSNYKNETEAFEASIQKWQKIVDNNGQDAMDSCPLCMFHDYICDDAVITQKTGVSSCHGTVFYSWRENKEKHSAQRMVDFLITLRDEFKKEDQTNEDQKETP